MLFKKRYLLTLVTFAAVIVACKSPSTTVSVKPYGVLSNGSSIEEYSLTTPLLRLKAITYGGIITQLEVPDRYGRWQDVVLGYDNLADYEFKNRYFGALIGRYSNRIANGLAKIDGQEIQLSVNRAPHHLHGGVKGFDKLVWSASTEQTGKAAILHLDLVSPDGAEGYPGELAVRVTYTVTSKGELWVEYSAKSSRTTIFNPTQHTYFNLSGAANSNVLEHELTINAERIVELTGDAIPTGKLLSVDTTPFDFSQPKTIGSAIELDHPQLMIGKGFDHYFWLQRHRGELKELANLYEPISGRLLTISTTEQGGQIYTGNYLNESVVGKGGVRSRKHQGICIETGQLPNAPAEPSFGTYLLRPSEPFYSKTIFAFSVRP